MYFSAEAVVLAPALLLAGLVFRPRGAQLVTLLTAVALIAAAFATRLQPFAIHTFLWAHLLQNVVLAEWAPALLVLAVPRSHAQRGPVAPRGPADRRRDDGGRAGGRPLRRLRRLRVALPAGRAARRRLLETDRLCQPLGRGEQPRVGEELARVLERGVEPDEHVAPAV